MKPVQIVIPFDRRLWGTAAIQRVAWNAAKMVRDLWLSRSPNLSGDYARGLQKSVSVQVQPGKIIVQNMSAHAAPHEYGTKAFNWGLAMLKSGKGVKRAKDGSKYRIIKIVATGRAAFRKQSVSSQVIASFQATVPHKRGQSVMAPIKRYDQHGRLGKKLKARKPLKGAMNGFFVVSEKAIKADPKKWFHEKKEGYHIARDVQREAEPIVARAFSQAKAAIAADKARRP